MFAPKTLTVRLLSAEICEIALREADTVDDLKLKLMERTGISPSCQRLVCRNNGPLNSGALALLDLFKNLDRVEVTLVRSQTTFVGSSPGIAMSDDGCSAHICRMTSATFWSSVWTDVIKSGTFALDLRLGAFGDIQNYVVSVATADDVEALKSWTARDMWHEAADLVGCLRFKFHNQERVCEYGQSSSVAFGSNDVISIEVNVDEQHMRLAVNGFWVRSRLPIGEGLQHQGLALVISLSTTRSDRHVTLCNTWSLRDPSESRHHPPEI